MAGRAQQRLQKQRLLEQQASDEGSDDDAEEEDALVAQPLSQQRRMDAMAMLMGGQGDTTSEEEETDSAVTTTTTTAATTASPTAIPDSDATLSTKSASKKKKKKKRAKKKKERPADDGGAHADVGGEGEAAASGERDSELAELESTIRKVKAMYNEADTPVLPDAAAAGSGALEGRRALLVVEKRHLNPDTEIRRMFGAGAARDNGGGGGAGPRRGAGGRGGPLYRKTVLAASKDTWPRFTKMGLQMNRDADADAAGAVGFAFVHSKEYQRVQMRFLAAVQTLDPAQISHLLEAHPSHIDALLQLSEVMRMGGDTQMAADFVERALFCFEQAFHPAFNFAAGECRLQYVTYANRGFFLALFRHIINVGNRGCWRTAFELTKLLLSLAPEEDPLAAVLMIDYYAVRSGQFAWLTRLAREWEDDHQLSWLPNMAYSSAFARRELALDQQTDDPAGSEAGLREADELLTRAITRFPAVVPLLAGKCGAMLRPEVLTHQLFAIPRVTAGTSAGCVRLLEVLFVERCHTLWKLPVVLEWLQKNAVATAALADSGDNLAAEAAERRRTHYRGIPRNVLRHVFVAEFPETNALIPADPEMGAMLAHDPFPPKGHRTEYDELAAEMSSQAGHGVGALEMFLRSLIPGFENAVAGLASQRQRQRRRGGGAVPAGAVGGDDEAEGGINVREWLGSMAEEIGVDNLLQALLAESQDDGNPDAAIPDDFNID